MKPMRPQVMIVDDTPANIKIIIGLLSDDYELMIATNGQECLDGVRSNPPDLILLDIMMPGMNGYETCQKLKSNPTTTNIPIIFMTAKSEEDDETKGLKLGAVDYIKKPFNMYIAKSRIDNHLELQRYRTDLELMVKEQSEQLIHADRLATMGTFAAGIAHEINNPTSFISGNVQTLQLFWKLAKPILEEHSSADHSGKVALMNDDIDDIFNGILKGAKRISIIVSSLKTYARRGTNEVNTPILISEPIDEAVTMLKNRITNQIKIGIDIPNQVKVIGNSQKLSQVFINLIGNAIDACDDKRAKIDLNVDEHESNILITIRDNGCGMSQEVQDQIFMPFFTTKNKTKGTGLGMAIIDSIIQEHNGSIELTSKIGEGTSFTISLPKIS